MKNLSKSFNDSSLLIPYSYLYISAHSKSPSQLVGFLTTSIYPDGPAKKYLHSSGSSLFAPNNILTVRIREKSNLCASNNDLHTFSYNDNVK